MRNPRSSPPMISARRPRSTTPSSKRITSGILTCRQPDGRRRGRRGRDHSRAGICRRLGVGLHLVLVEGPPRAAAAHRIPDLDRRHRPFPYQHGARRRSNFFFRPSPSGAQLAAEIEAQFAAFHATGLPLDHVNAHKHFHLHPTIAGLILSIGRRYGLAAARAPVEPLDAACPGSSPCSRHFSRTGSPPPMRAASRKPVPRRRPRRARSRARPRVERPDDAPAESPRLIAQAARRG